MPSKVKECTEYSQGQEGTYRCTGKCEWTAGNVWGSNPYTSDSTVCKCARHAGIIPEAGGAFKVKVTAGCAEYKSVSAHGITPYTYGSYHQSITVSRAGVSSIDKEALEAKLKLRKEKEMKRQLAMHRSAAPVSADEWKQATTTVTGNETHAHLGHIVVAAAESDGNAAFGALFVLARATARQGAAVCSSGMTTSEGIPQSQFQSLTVV